MDIDGHSVDVSSICADLGYNSEPINTQRPKNSPVNNPHSTPFIHIKIMIIIVFFWKK